MGDLKEKILKDYNKKSLEHACDIYTIFSCYGSMVKKNLKSF